MSIRAYINLIQEAQSSDHNEYLRQCAELDKAIFAARVAFNEARDAGDQKAASEAFKAFRVAEKARRDLDDARPAPGPVAAPEPEAEDYRGQHTAPDHESGSPMFDLTANGIYPADFYTGRMHEYLSDPDEREVLDAIYNCKGRPNRAITIYRSMPVGLPRKINVGDWVTTSKRYAREHGRSHLQGEFMIVQKTVCARDIFTAGDSLLEWGYDPQPRVAMPPRNRTPKGPEA